MFKLNFVQSQNVYEARFEQFYKSLVSNCVEPLTFSVCILSSDVVLVFLNVHIFSLFRLAMSANNSIFYRWILFLKGEK